MTQVGLGDIVHVPDFYADSETGDLRAKYLLILAQHAHGDFIARLLTSRTHGRPESPPCFHGTPYPGYFLGVIGTRLDRPTWIDLRGLDDIDHAELADSANRGAAVVHSIDRVVLANAMACVAGADDTTRAQERALRDALARLRGSN